MTEKAVCIISGGPDSAIASALVQEQRGADLYAITFIYGQQGTREIMFSNYVAEWLGVKEHKIVDLRSLGEIFGRIPLLDPMVEMPSQFKPSLIVPFRNGIFISVAAAWAESIGAEIIVYGAHGSDEPYPDCTPDFVDAMERALQSGTGSGILISAPLINLSKAEAFKEGQRLGLPFDETWSCYALSVSHCGTCESCRNRKQAFIDAGIPDPTYYMVTKTEGP